MMKDAKRLSDLIGSRICHDLISPLRAISNGVELMAMSGATTAPEMALISESVENANARIRFFRVAFGAAASEARITRGEILSIVDAMYRGSRNRVEWKVAGNLPREDAKLAFLLLLCFESALPWGGQIVADRNGNGTWTMTAESERQKMDDHLWQMLNGGEGDVSPSDVHFALAGWQARQMERRISLESGPRRIMLSF